MTMAKDPAFLFYPNDYIGGTMGMTFEQKGAYIELLMLQFNRGHMDSHMINHTVGQLWHVIKSKFTQDENGLWYNQRLDIEKTKRKAFSESRRNNIKGKNQFTQGHMTKHMENEDEDVNDIINDNDNEKLMMPFTSEKFIKYWGIWKDYKTKEYNFKFKSISSEQAGLNKLVKLSDGYEETAIKIIEESLANNWKGFFKLKNETNATTNNYSKLAPKVTMQQLDEAFAKRNREWK
jgi:hypothetical protein